MQPFARNRWIADQQANAESCHVTLELAPSIHAGTVQLVWIARDAGSAQGSGAQVLRSLCVNADRAGLALELSVLGGAERLAAFYTGHGFRLQQAGSADCDPVMVRPAARRARNSVRKAA